LIIPLPLWQLIICNLNQEIAKVKFILQVKQLTDRTIGQLIFACSIVVELIFWMLDGINRNFKKELLAILSDVRSYTNSYLRYSLINSIKIQFYNEILDLYSLIL